MPLRAVIMFALAVIAAGCGWSGALSRSDQAHPDAEPQLILDATGPDGVSDSADEILADDATEGTTASDAAANGDALSSSDTAEAQTPDISDSEPGAATVYRYDPLNDDELTTFPDDFYTVDDASTLTGLRVSLTGENASWLAAVPPNLLPTYQQANRLDGFGTTAGIVLRFTGQLGNVPSGDPQSVTNAALLLVELTGDGVIRIPYETTLVDNGETVLLVPMRPLRPRTRHGVIVTTALKDAEGKAILPSAQLKSLLDGTASVGRFAALNARYAELLSKASIAKSEVSAATVFTTQSIFDQSIAIAEDIKQRQYVWKTAPLCSTESLFRYCSGSFIANDYRTNGVVEGHVPISTYELKVAIWLPKTTAGPWPTMIFGHGIGGNKLAHGEDVASVAVPQGFVVVAIDAVAHGEHPPDSSPSDSYLTILARFFAIELTFPPVLDPLAQRDNWRQSTYDKLQLLQLITALPDLDGDNSPDVDPDQLLYFGISLGSIMGNELLALSDQFKLGVLSVGGGRVVSIVSDADAFSGVTDLVKPVGWSDGDLARAFPLVQMLIDAGDGANYAAHILTDRFTIGGSQPPHLLVLMALNDDTVPNVSTLAQVRAMGIPALAPRFIEPGLLPTIDQLPLQGNLQEGTLTAGFFQFDRVTKKEGGPVIKAQHAGMHQGREFLLQLSTFIASWRDHPQRIPQIVDPYALLATPPLP